MKYWLFKSEPDVFGIDALAAMPKRSCHWDGVRNFQARNMMRDEMRRGDLGFFYHSSCPEPAITGTVKILGGGYPDHTAFDASSKYFDGDSDPAAPRWFMVDVQLLRKFAQPITLGTLRRYSDGKLRDMWLLRRGNRLSITPVTAAHWTFINSLAAKQDAHDARRPRKKALRAIREILK
jgi:predicted RNA-binding protein with PUA-like domain